MSVRWMRTATIKNGRFMEAIAWGKEVAGYVEKKWGAGKCDVWVDAFGAVGTIRWSIDFTDLASIDKVQGAMMADPDYWKMVEKAMKSELFVDGSAVDNVFRSV